MQFIGAIIMAGLSLAVSSCSTGGRSPSGFLANYAQLDAGYGTADAVASYVKPGVDLTKYDSVIFEPVTTVVAAPGISPQVKDQLAAYLSESLRSQVPAGIKLASSPGPGTLRVRTALTDVIEGQKGGKAVTTIHGNPRTSLSGSLGSDSLASFISSVSFEGEILDSTTGERLSALSDHRLGAKRPATATTSWAAVRSASNQGAARLWQRYLSARGN
jgi:hypothetical protein